MMEKDATGLPRGSISHHPIANTGDLGRLEDALCLWVQGDTIEAEPHLLQMLDLMKPYNKAHTRLYRGIVMDHQEDCEKAIREGLTIHHQHKSLESWSTDPYAVRDFMHGWERPCIMLAVDGSILEPIIDLELFNSVAKPFTVMTGQAEVIVLAKPEMFYSPENISLITHQHDDNEDEDY